MSFLSWNCRRLRNQCTVQELTRLVRVQAPSAVFCIETWSNEESLEFLRCRLHFNNKLVVPSNKKGGGLALFWNSDFNLSVKSFSCNHIDSVIDEGIPEAWRLTFFYGAPETHRRIETWNLLRRLNQQFLLPWCCMGDFNEIVKNEEMHGRNRHPDRQMQGFRDAMDECDLLDLGYWGSPFTWCNNRDPLATTWVRLDRGLANLSWVKKFLAALVEHLDVINSDHKCLILTREPRGAHCFQRKPFRFEEVWTSDEGCENTIQAAWGSAIPGSAMFKVVEK